MRSESASRLTAVAAALLSVFAIIGPAGAGNGVWTSTYPYGGHIGGQGMTVDPTTGRLDVVPTHRGLYASVDAAASWQNTTDGVTDLPFWPDALYGVYRGIDGSLHVIVWQGPRRLYRSDDDGATWYSADDDIGGEDLVVFAVDPTNSSVFYAGTSNGLLYKTTDATASWSQIGSGLPGEEVRSIEVDPVAASNVYVGMGSSGIYKSTDGGATVTGINHGASLTWVEDILVDPSNPLIVYAADNGDPDGKGIFKSSDGGASWTKLAPAMEFGGWTQTLLALDPGNTAVLYAVSWGEMFKSTDSGATWSSVVLDMSVQTTVVLVDPATPTTIYAGTSGEGVWKSTDGGATWNALNSGMQARGFPVSRPHSLHFDVNTANLIYTGGQVGGFRSTDNGASWSRMSLGFQVPTLVTRPGDVGGVWAFDYQLWRSTDSGVTWADGSNGAFCCFLEGDVALHSTDPLTLYVGTGNPWDVYAQGVYKTTDGGATWNLVNNGLPSPERMYTLTVDPNDGDVVYAAMNGWWWGGGDPSGVFKTTDGGANWFQLGGGLPDPIGVNQILVHPADSNLVFMAAEGDGVYRSTDAGASWAKILTANPTSVAVDPGDANRIYAGTWTGPGMFRSVDGGNTWAAVVNGLPTEPNASSIVLDPANTSRVLLGTAAGAWEYTFSGTVELTVVSSDDSGPGSLRDALEQANQDGVPNVITFAPWMAGATIHLASELPGLNEGNTTIDGDLDDDCVPDIAIDGQWMPNANGLNIHSNGNRVTGLAIHSFDCPGCGGDLIVLWSAHDNVIDCNYLGTDLSGTNPLGTQTFGIKVVDGSTGNVMGPGNRIVYNGTGILIENGSSGNTVGPDNTLAFAGNDAIRIEDGVDWAYPEFAALTGDPIQVFPLISFTDDGGTTAFHSTDGITPVDSAGYTFHEGFGARFTGTLTVGAAGTYTFDLEHDDNVRLTVGGSELFEGGCCGGTSLGAALGTGGHAIRIDFAEGGGHARLGLAVTGPGSADLSTDGNTGGCATGQPGLCGELFQLRIASDFNTITRNSIHDNGALGINLESGGDDWGVTANDPGDADIGPNTLINFPEITTVVDLGGGDYSLDGTAPPDSAVEIFAAAVDPSGHGEGKEYLDTLTADPGGAFSGTVTLPPGYFAVTATATDLDGNTSEFSYRSVMQPNFLTVDNAGDSGPGSLRDAIDQANADGVTTIIDFAPGLAGGTIQLLSQLPALTDSETAIDGDLNGDCMPDIELDGQLTGGSGLEVYSSDNLIRGLAVNRFPGDGLLIANWTAGPADDNVVECNFIGTDLTGTAALPNGSAGVGIYGQAANNVIGGPQATARNLISGNGWVGVNLSSEQGNTVEGNFIGADISGTNPLGNQHNGVQVSGSQHQIGPDNVISGNGWVGIYMPNVQDTVVEGNFIGTDLSGLLPLGNDAEGIHLDGSAAGGRIGPNNTLAFNQGAGVSLAANLQGPGWPDFTGITPDATEVFPLIHFTSNCSPFRSADGITPVDGGGNPFIEYFSARFTGTLNVDSAGDYSFDLIELGGSARITVDGGVILDVGCCGTQGTTVFLSAGGHDVELAFGQWSGPVSLRLDVNGPGGVGLSTDGNVGGCPGGQSGLCGEILHQREDPNAVQITRNSIFDNQGLGIDLYTCEWQGVTANDPGDGDDGPNGLLNFPEFTGFTDLGGGSFTVDGTAPPDSTVEIFAADHDPTGHGEGREYLDTVTADPSGDFSATIVLSAGLYAVTATATDPGGSTSEFSANLALRANEIAVANPGDSGPGSLRDAIDEANYDRADTVITFDPALAGQTIHLLDALPSLTEDNTVIDGDLDDDCVPDVGLDGSLVNGTGLLITSSDSVVRGLAIGNFSDGDGIVIASWNGAEANGNVVECSYLGTDLDGTTPAGNRWSGVVIEGAASDNRVGPGNVLAFNQRDGVTLYFGALYLYPHFLGAVPDPVQVFPLIDFDNDGGAFESADGIVPVDGGGTPFTDHFGARFTGTLNVDAAGDYTFDLPGVDDYARILVDGESIIYAFSWGNNSVNWSLSSGDHAFEVDYWQWGGPAHLELQISGPGTPTLTTDGNGAGCPIGQGGLCGEFFQLGRTPIRNRITQSSIHSNDNLGIDLGGDYVTPNDPGDGDGGANGQLNFPEFTGFTDLGGGSYAVDGTATPGSTVELFAAAPDPSGYGEGKEYLTSVVALPDGSFSFTAGLPPEVASFTATATDADGNTSEFSELFAVKAPDEVNLGSGSGYQGDTLEVPVYVRDLEATPLGLDQPAGSRIQGFTFQVQFSPSSGVVAANAYHSGVTAGLTPLFDTFVTTADTLTYVASFDETANLVPLTLGGSGPGDEVARLVVTLDPGAPPTPIQLTLLGGTVLSNESGTLTETEGSLLTLGHGSIDVLTRAATTAFAMAQSSSEIRVTWTDPGADETGLRLERSTDGASWSTIATLGPDETAYFDGGLPAATLFYYRVTAFQGGADAPPSNVAWAETHPATAARTCVSQVSDDHSWARFPTPAWNGTLWANLFQERVGSTNDEVFFQFVDPWGNPTGSQVQVSRNDMMSQFPTLRWNGSHFGALWTQHMRGPAGEVTSNNFFALLDANGQVVRRGVRLFDTAPMGSLNVDLGWALEWDGGGWGHFHPDYFSPNDSNVGYWRFSEDGELLTGPVQISFTSGGEGDVSVVWSGAEYGVAWVHELAGDSEVLFQRVLPDGSLPGPPVTVWQSTAGEGADYSSVVWNGAGWAVAWTIIENDGTWPLHLRVLAADGTPLGPVKRLSDDFDPDFPGQQLPIYDESPELVALPGGGYVCYTSSYTFLSNSYEIARLEADAGGDRVGQRTILSDADGAISIWPRVASNGADDLVLFNDHRQGSQEMGSMVVAHDGSVVAGPNDMSCCHSPGDTYYFNSGGVAGTVPVMDGFLAAWTDEQSGSRHPYVQLFDGAGNPWTSYRPLSGRDVNGLPGIESLGDTFAVAWKDGGGTVVFDRYDVHGGGSMLGEVEVAHDSGGRGTVALAFSGEEFGLVYFDGGDVVLKRVDPGGSVVEPPTVIADTGRQSPQVQWTGAGWALIWRGPGGYLYYALVDRYGTVAAGPQQVTASPTWGTRYDLVWGAGGLGLTWVDGTDQGTYFNILDLNGNPTLGDVLVLDAFTGFPQLYWAGDRFRLVRGGCSAGGTDEDCIFEDEILTDGTLIPAVRQLTNRGTPGFAAYNGATAGLLWSQMREVYFQTTECLDDPTPPACPDLSVSFDDVAVQLDWSAVDDPESTIWRYNLYRDGFMLAELFAGTQHYEDAGWRAGAVHDYEVRALNGAYRESVDCPVTTFSLATGDGNGDGTVDAADVFYLINYLYAGGAPPRGDADANGDGVVDAGDVFYLIFYIFDGGPPPRLPEADVADLLLLGDAAALPGATVQVPVRIGDRSGTPLGEDGGTGWGIQGFAFRVDFDPTHVASVSYVQAGVTGGKAPIFPVVQTAEDHAVVLQSFDESTAPLAFTPGGVPTDLVGLLVVELRTAVRPGTIVGLTLDAASALVNGDATVSETPASGTLILGDGTITVEAPVPEPIFGDGFESGNLSAWSRSVGG